MCLAPRAEAQRAYQVSDINRISPSAQLTRAGDLLFFTRSDSTRGAQLWKSNGTPEGTVLVKVINPQPIQAVRHLTDVNGTLFFTADDGIHGEELWKSDGTDAGTLMVKDIYRVSGTPLFPLGNLTNMNGALFFTADDGIHGSELWKSDGTMAGTVLVKDINPQQSGVGPGRLAAVNGTLFFTANDGTSGIELWKSDGTQAGTVLVRDIKPGTGSSVADDPNLKPGQCCEPLEYVAAVGGRLFFVADDGVHGWALWKSDGTYDGTVLVRDVNPDTKGVGTFARMFSLTAVGGTLYFVASDGIADGLWKSDGTEAGTVLVSPDFATELTDVNGTLFFVQHDDLWRSDGTVSGTVIVNSSTGWVRNPGGLVNVSGTLFLSADDGVHGEELWRSDGTPPGTLLVKDILAGSGGSSLGALTDVGGRLFFVANGSLGGSDLWTSDGTEGGTFPLPVSWGAPSNPSSLTDAGGTLVFAADDGRSGRELWRSDGTDVGTTLLTDVNQGSDGSNPATFVNVNGRVYFGATVPGGGEELGSTNGTTTTLVGGWGAPVNGTSYRDPDYGDLLYFFRCYDGTTACSRGGALGRSDGTEYGTYVVWNVFTSGKGFSKLVTAATPKRDTLFFLADLGASGLQLWKSQGAYDDTVLVKQFLTGAAGYPIAVVGGTVYFGASDGVSGQELWKSDGTAAGTVLVKDIHPGSGSSSPSNLVNVNGTLFFAADDGSGGVELWKSDGTASGTMRVKDIAPGPASSSPSNLVAAGGTLFLTASDGSSGVELWKSDGTEAGTALVEDIFPGPDSSNPSSLAAVNEVVFFSANDGASGQELWVSDGTEPGTRLVADVAGGASSSAPAELTRSGERLFFSADDGATGRELWAVRNRAPVANAGPDQTLDLGTPVTLDGFSSFDPDGDALAYEWRDEMGAWVGSSAVLTVSAAVGSHAFTLRVSDGLGGVSSDTANVTVNPVPPTVSVSAPSGIAILSGVPFAIQWSVSGGGPITVIDTAYSLDGGATYSPVAGCTGLAGDTVSCTWASPGPATPQARVRVTATAATGLKGMGESSFSVVDPFVTVTSPSGPVTWLPGSTKPIGWQHNLPAGATVKIELSRDGGSSWTVISPTASAAPGTFAWPVTGPSTGAARGRVTWTARPSVSDMTDVNFIINSGDTSMAKDVVWTNIVGVSASGNGIAKTGASGWNSGAVSTKAIVSGDGYMEFTAAETTTNRMAGLGNGDSSQSYGDIEFAVYVKADKTVALYESGALLGGFGTYAAGDRFRVAIESGVVTYRKNGALLYASSKAPGPYPLRVDTSLFTPGATVANVIIAGTDNVAWVNAAGVSTSGNSITKTDVSTAWNAGAASSKAIPLGGDGYMAFVAAETTTNRMAGLGNSDSSQSYADIDYAFDLRGDRTLRIYEAGTSRGSFGTYATGDRFRVEVISGIVRYRKNGVLLYTSTVPPVGSLRVDTSLFTTGATVAKVVIDGDLEDKVSWTNLVGVTASGSSLTKTASAGWNAGASSTQAIAYGDGYMEFTATETTTSRMAGLGRSDIGQGPDDIDFAIRLKRDGMLAVYESGTLVASAGGYGSGDRLRVEMGSGIVRYLRNGVLIYTSGKVPAYPVRVDTSLDDTGATLTNVAISDP